MTTIRTWKLRSERIPIGVHLEDLIVPFRVMHGLDPCIQGRRDRGCRFQAGRWLIIRQASALDTPVKPAYDAERFAKLA